LLYLINKFLKIFIVVLKTIFLQSCDQYLRIIKEELLFRRGIGFLKEELVVNITKFNTFIFTYTHILSTYSI